MMDDCDIDPLFDQVSAFVTEKKNVSTAAIQRNFRIGYNRASRLVEQLEFFGVVSSPDANGNRNVLTLQSKSLSQSDRYNYAINNSRDIGKNIDEINSVQYQSRIEAITNKRIVIWLEQKTARSKASPPVFIIRSHSPFNELAEKQKVDKDIAIEPLGDLITGYKFVATMQMRNSARILRQHGRIERVASWKLPKIINEQWQGVWIPVTKSWREMGIDVEEKSTGTMASDIGQIPESGGDYLRFILFVKHLNSLDISYNEKKEWINICYHMIGEDGEPFCKFMAAYGDDIEQMASRLLD